jgi:hypothetical protein
VPEPLIERDEIVGLLFTVSDISNTLLRIEALLETTVRRKKLTRAEREEREAERSLARQNARRVRELAERAQAKLDAERSNA